MGDVLYYQGDFTWAITHDIKKVDLNKISEGITSTFPITESSRAQLFKIADKLIYTSSENALSPVNNFYEFNPTGMDPLILTDVFLFPKNFRTVENFVYFSISNDPMRFANLI
ncbi:hypothetical protein D2V08_03410 [Flagellimonas lutimaris]|uniref:Uncharacterized protein n=1 Tax=Flagellimonas lutimaris TaxID=475082 RepID=A0A3A1NG06_9FLAO|nr:hypothetical protein [Allomuricauda lutimaris]RIV36007.1 hypothetical protein D2V08_03410 [Allomuricauda lutimaris]